MLLILIVKDVNTKDDIFFLLRCQQFSLVSNYHILP